MSSPGSLVPPLRFAEVAPGVYRGSYPGKRYVRFLQSLNLRTTVSLTPIDPLGNPYLNDWMHPNPGIRTVWHEVHKAKKGEAVENLSLSTVREVVEVKNKDQTRLFFILC
jgi:hypothetical protein